MKEDPRYVQICHIKAPPDHWWKAIESRVKKYQCELEEYLGSSTKARKDDLITSQRSPNKCREHQTEAWNDLLGNDITLVHEEFQIHPYVQKVQFWSM